MGKDNKNSKKLRISFKKIIDEIKNRISKITSFKIKEDKTLNKTKIIIEGDSKMTEGIVKKTKTKKTPELHPEIKQFMEQQTKFNNNVNEFMEQQTKFNGDVKEFIHEQRKFNQIQNEKWEEQAKFNKSQNEKWEEQIKFNKQMQETNQVILSSIQEILLRIQRIEKCPTIKKELDELE